jgi:hypothetical protein
VSSDGGTGFCVPVGAVRGPSVGQLWAKTRWRAIVLKLGFGLAKRLSTGLLRWPAAGVICGPSAGRAGKLRTHGGRRPRSSRGCRAVGVTAGFRVVARSVHTAGSSTDGHGPGPRARLEDVVDLLVEDVVLAVDAVGVDGEQDRDAVPGPGDEKALGRYRKTRLFTSGALTLDLLACYDPPLPFASQRVPGVGPVILLVAENLATYTSFLTAARALGAATRPDLHVA